MTIADKLALLEQTKEAQRVKLGLPKGLPFSQYIKFIRDPFTIPDLFKNGEQGVWLDPSDLKTMYQDVNGTVPVTKDGDPVALIKDKSGNGNHATQTTTSARPAYRTDGILHWLEFDGVDDYLITPELGLKTTYSLVLAFYQKSLPVGLKHYFSSGGGSDALLYAAGGTNKFRWGSPSGEVTTERLVKKYLMRALISGANLKYINEKGDIEEVSSGGIVLGGLVIGGHIRASSYANISMYQLISASNDRYDDKYLELHIKNKAGLPL